MCAGELVRETSDGSFVVNLAGLENFHGGTLGTILYVVPVVSGDM